MIEIFPLKAQYKLSENVILRINSDEKIIKANIAIFYLNKQLKSINIEKPFNTKDIEINTHLFKHGGYGVNLIAETLRNKYETYTSFDICRNINDSLRYGFVSDFTEKDLKNGAMDWLRKCHINIVQFYDWSYRHDNLTCDDDYYVDMMGKHISRNVVISKNKEATSYGIRGIAYGAVYAASKQFFLKHKDWALYYPDNKPITFIDVFYLMNIEKESPWCKHLINQYYLAIKKMGFTGIHMDTYGFPKTAISRLNGRNYNVNLDSEFPMLINDTRSILESKNINPLLIFNNVGNWPVYATANSKVDAVYVEVWDPYNKYHHIASIIKDAKKILKKNKPVIIAAYLKPFRLESIDRGMNAAKLLMAEIVSNGAYHLLIGENKAVLTQGYYSDYTKLDDSSAQEIRSYYDFMIRYYDLFYNKSFKDVSHTHFFGDNREYMSSCKKISVNYEDNKIWAIIKENNKHKVISLINLCGNKDDTWNSGKNHPIEQHNITFSVAIDNYIKGVYIASPDYGNQIMKEINYQTIDNEMGRYVKFTVPRVDYWTIVDIELYEVRHGK